MNVVYYEKNNRVLFSFKEDMTIRKELENSSQTLNLSSKLDGRFLKHDCKLKIKYFLVIQAIQ